jgi:hypothetical protein
LLELGEVEKAVELAATFVPPDPVLAEAALSAFKHVRNSAAVPRQEVIRAVCFPTVAMT